MPRALECRERGESTAVRRDDSQRTPAEEIATQAGFLSGETRAGYGCFFYQVGQRGLVRSAVSPKTRRGWSDAQNVIVSPISTRTRRKGPSKNKNASRILF